MIADPKRRTPSLLQQIDRVRDYNQHRRRVDHTRRFSPLANLKKSISYDRQKLSLHQYIKLRKGYTSKFNQHCTDNLKGHEQRDAKMLQNIIEYDSREFVFSMNNNRGSRGSLHHNSLVYNNQKHNQIDQQNQQMHFRITKAKSLYSHLFPSKALWSSRRKEEFPHKESRLGSQFLKDKQYTEWEVDNEEESPQNGFQLSNKFKMIHSQLRLDQGTPNYMAKSETFTKNEQTTQHSRVGDSMSSRRLCERTRRQRLAQTLYERKQKWQKSVVSKLQIRS